MSGLEPDPEPDPNPLFQEMDPRIGIKIKKKRIRNTEKTGSNWEILYYVARINTTREHK